MTQYRGNKKQSKQAKNNPQNHTNGSSKPEPNHTNASTKPISIFTKFVELVNPSNPLPQNQNSPQNPKINHWHENCTREDINKPFPNRKQPFYLWFNPIAKKE